MLSSEIHRHRRNMMISMIQGNSWVGPAGKCQLWFDFWNMSNGETPRDLSGNGNDGTAIGVTPRPILSPVEIVTNGTMEAATADGANLITNPGFETIGSELVTNGGFASATTGWLESDGTIASAGGGQSGNCLTITRVAGDTQEARQTFSVPLTSGKIYRLQYYIKSGTSGDENSLVQITKAGVGNTVSYSVATTGSWVLQEKFFAADSNSEQIALIKNSATAGTMLFDSVSVKEVLSGWSLAPETGTIELSSTAHAGLSVKITSLGGDTPRVYEPISVTAGHYYRLGFWTRGTGSDAGQTAFYDATNGSYILNWQLTGVTGAAFAYVEYVMKAPAGCTDILVIYGMSSAGSAYFDDVSVAECFAPTGWSETGTPEAIDRSTIQKHGASYSLHINDLTASYGGNYQVISGKAIGKSYKLSFWYYIVSGTLYGRLSNGLNNAWLSANTVLDTTGAWTYREEIVIETNTGDLGRITFQNVVNDTPAEFYIDDVSIREVIGYDMLGAYFDGVDDVVLASIAGGVVPPLSMVGWVNINEIGVASTIFDLKGVADIMIDIAASNLRATEYGVGDVDLGGSSHAWTCVALTMNAAFVVKGYLNGVYVGTFNGSDPALTGEFYVGSMQALANTWTKGSSGEVRVFSSELTAAEIYDHYQATRKIPGV